MSRRTLKESAYRLRSEHRRAEFEIFLTAHSALIAILFVLGKEFHADIAQRLHDMRQRLRLRPIFHLHARDKQISIRHLSESSCLNRRDWFARDVRKDDLHWIIAREGQLVRQQFVQQHAKAVPAWGKQKSA